MTTRDQCAFSFVQVVSVLLVLLTISQHFGTSSDVSHVTFPSLSMVNKSYSQIIWRYSSHSTDYNISSASSKELFSTLMIIIIALVAFIMILWGAILWNCCYTPKDATIMNGLKKDVLIKGNRKPNQSKALIKTFSGKAKPKQKAKLKACDFLPVSLDNASLLPSLKSEVDSQPDKPTSQMTLHSNDTTEERSSCKQSALKGSSTKGSSRKSSSARKRSCKKRSSKKRASRKRSSKNDFTTKAIKLKMQSPKCQSKTKNYHKKTQSKRSKRLCSKFKKNKSKGQQK